MTKQERERVMGMITWATEKLAPDMDVVGCMCEYCHVNLNLQKIEDRYEFVGHDTTCEWNNFRTALPAALAASERLERENEELGKGQIELASELCRYQTIWKEQRIRAETAEAQLAEARKALRWWVKEYGSNFNSGYMYSSGKPCKCMLCTAKAILRPEPGKSQGQCDTTMTERFYNPNCKCPTYPGNLGPCKSFEVGGNGRCPYCDHEKECHDAIEPNAPSMIARSK